MISKHNCLDQNGFASLIVGLILVLVLSLLTVGFAHLVREEQRQTLDKQLSTQAFYAAESGVNEAIAQLPNAFNSCPATGNHVLNAANKVEYTCVTTNLHPPNLGFGDVGMGSTTSQFTSYDSSSGSSPGITSITLQWNCRPTGGGSVSNCVLPTTTSGLPTGSIWNAGGVDTGILEVSLTPLSSAANDTAANLISHTFTAVLYPKSSAAAGTIVDTSTSGSTVISGCSTVTKICTATINVSAGVNTYLIRLRSLYDDSSVMLTLNGGATSFLNGQAVIDATGKAQDVLKRIQVRVPLSQSGQYPSALQANTICKILDVGPASGQTKKDASITDSDCDLN